MQNVINATNKIQDALLSGDAPYIFQSHYGEIEISYLCVNNDDYDDDGEDLNLPKPLDDGYLANPGQTYFAARLQTTDGKIVYVTGITICSALTEVYHHMARIQMDADLSNI